MGTLQKLPLCAPNPKTIYINRNHCGLCCICVVADQPRRWSSRLIGIEFTFLYMVFIISGERGYNGDPSGGKTWNHRKRVNKNAKTH